MARRDTLTAVDTAATGVGLLAWGVATRNRPVAITGFATAAAVAAAAAAGWWVAAAIAAGAGWLIQAAIAARQPKGLKFADAAAVAIGAVSAVHYATAINLRYTPPKLMALSRTVIRVCHLVSALVAVVILTAGDELYTAWGCYGTLRLDRLDLGCCGDDPDLRWVAEANGPAAICRTLPNGCEPTPAGQTAWFGRAAAVAAHFQASIPSAPAVAAATYVATVAIAVDTVTTT